MHEAGSGDQAITAFIGYVLPWKQMSFWGATVIMHATDASDVPNAASTNSSEQTRSNDSAALNTTLIALDTDGTGEEEW